jgi:hypothetical protein
MIRPGQLRVYGSAVMPEDNLVENVGGAIDRYTSLDFSDLDVNDRLQVVSSEVGDIAPITIHGRVVSGMIQSESVTLTGTVPHMTTQVAWERIMKVVKSASTSGTIAVERVTAVRTGTLQGPGVESNLVVLDLGASSIDGYYVGLVLRVTTGLGASQIAKVLSYYGSGREVTLDTNFSAVDETSEYRLSKGVVMHKLPIECLTVRRPFYNALADLSGGSERSYYEKFFWRNDSSETLMTDVNVREVMNPTGRISFALESVLDGTGSNGAHHNRLVAPPDLVFSRNEQVVPTSQLLGSQAIGVWLRFTLPAGQQPIKSSYLTGLQGQTI